MWTKTMDLDKSRLLNSKTAYSTEPGQKKKKTHAFPVPPGRDEIHLTLALYV